MELIDFIRSIACAGIVLFLFFKYLKNNGLVLHLLFISFALRYFSIPFIGPTIDVMYLFCLAVGALEVISFLSGKIKLAGSKLFLFALPFILFPLFLIVYSIQNNHYLDNLNPIAWYIKTSASYIKTFLPYFMIGVVIKRYAHSIDVDDLFRTILKIANYSCILALVQFIAFILLYNHNILLQILGLNGAYNYQYGTGGINLVRVQAFFYEPKSFAAFLGLSLPIAIYFNQRKKALLFLAVGFLTLSQTFFVILLGALIVFVLLKNIQNIRLSVFWSITLIVAFFFSVSSLKNYLLEKYATQEETIAYKIFLDRAFQRYSLDEEDNELMGIPLQPDIELPAVNFLRDNQLFLLTGFGPGNYNTIPFKYFISQWNIDAIERGTFKGHFDMGWIYLIAEFGLLFFLVIFFVLTGIKHSGFESKFYAFLWLIFFFHRIDFLLVAFFCLLFYKNLNRENLYNNNILQPGEVS
jgi:hypothetical protein